jgi:alpha-tubulin suppressor-like RCC1 family protein
MVEISAGSLHTCGLTAGGQAWCWGDNRWGNLGDGTSVMRTRATAVTDGHVFQRISAGQDRTCGITMARQVWCWGSNGGSINSAFPNDPTGILGIGILTTPMERPRQVSGTHQWDDVSAGYRYSCGRLPDLSVRCWGANVYAGQRGGMLGDGSMVARPAPVLIAAGSTAFTYVGAGFFSACALSDEGDAWCWGTNHSGEVGDGGASELPASTNHATPVKVTGGHKFAALAMSKLNACGIKQSGEVWCWGSNQFGQLGDGTMANSATPVRVIP